jgi:Plant mobile domain
LDCRAHKPVIPFDERCVPILKMLGLYQLSLVPYTKTDPRLITTLVEHWRPETHTFHLPVGEVTVTLQDVSCLWGLPISGPLVIERSDGGTAKLIRDTFGIDINAEMMKKKCRTGRGENQEDVIKESGFSISLKWLRTTYAELADDATEDDVTQYTQVYLLDLFGSVLFPDSSGDSVPVMYLKFLQDIESIIDDDNDDQEDEAPIGDTAKVPHDDYHSYDFLASQASYHDVDTAPTQPPYFASSQHPPYDDLGPVQTQPSQSDFVASFYPPSQADYASSFMDMLFGSVPTEVYFV